MSNNESTLQPTDSEKMKVDFARFVFSNCQELIRLIDQKSSLLLAVIALFSAALFIIVGYMSGQSGDIKYLVVALIFWYLMHTAQAIWHAVLTAKARPNTLGNRCNAPEMIFPLMILSKYQESDADYLHTLQQIELRDILADYSQQIMEVSNIYRLKQSHVNKATKQLLWSALPWFLLVTTVIIDQVVPTSSMVKTYVLSVSVLALAIPGWLMIRKT